MSYRRETGMPVEVMVIESFGNRLGSGERSTNASLQVVLGYVAVRDSEYTHSVLECKGERRQRPSLNCAFARFLSYLLLLPLARPTRRRAPATHGSFYDAEVLGNVLAIESQKAMLPERMQTDPLNVGRET
jgi:hypothetical protein